MNRFASALRRAPWLSVPALLALLVGLSACSVKFGSYIEIDRPQGFAETREKNSYRAVSPEGMLFGVRTENNDPEKGLEFWSRALQNHLAKEGYRLLPDIELLGESFQAAESEGRLFEWVVPFGNADYIYLTAIVLGGKKIAVAEAAGEHAVYRNHRAAMLESLKTLKFR